MKIRTLTYKKLITQHLKILKSLQRSSGLFIASKNRKTGYNKAWLRDNFYECLAFDIIDDWVTVKRTYRALLNIFLKHEYKIDMAIKKRPEHAYEFIHARFNPDTFDEYWEEWGNKQNDSIGAILFMIGELEHSKKISIIENKNDLRIINKLVMYLNTIEYWHDKDSGMWEEEEEVHASSIGACVAGLKNIKNIKGVDVPDELIKKGEISLNNMLPRESKKKFVDLALLSLIWPYNVVTTQQRDVILKNVIYHLEKKRGVIRYKGDHYYNKNPDNYSEEAEWVFGISWLSIIFDKLGERKKAEHYLKKAMPLVTPKGVVPELYFSNSPKFDENTPLGWAESLFIVALYEFNKKYRLGR